MVWWIQHCMYLLELVSEIQFANIYWEIPGGASGKEPACQHRRCKRHESNPWVRKIPWRRKWQPTLVFLPGESHGQRSIAGYSPWDHRESDTTEGNLAPALLRNFASMLFRDMVLSFSVFVLFLFSFGIRVIVVL